MPDSKQDIVLSNQSVGHAKLEPFDGVGDVQRFLDHFDVVARANDWSSEVQILQLQAALTGSAFDLYRRLSVEERDNVAKLRAALDKEFGSCALESDYARRFVSRRRKVGESLSDFAEALRSLGRKAYPAFSDKQLDNLYQTHFIESGLAETLQVQSLVGSTVQLSRLSVEERDNVAKLRAALDKEFGSCALESDYARRFVSRRRKVGESLSDFAEALRSLGRKAYPAFSDKQLDNLYQTHFIESGLAETLQVQSLVGATVQESSREFVVPARRLEPVFTPSLVRAVGVEGPQAGAACACSEQRSQIEKLTEVVAALEKKVEALHRERSSNKPQSCRSVRGKRGRRSRLCPKKNDRTHDKTRLFQVTRSHAVRLCKFLVSATGVGRPVVLSSVLGQGTDSSIPMPLRTDGSYGCSVSSPDTECHPVPGGLEEVLAPLSLHEPGPASVSPGLMDSCPLTPAAAVPGPPTSSPPAAAVPHRPAWSPPAAADRRRPASSLRAAAVPGPPTSSPPAAAVPHRPAWSPPAAADRRRPASSLRAAAVRPPLIWSRRAAADWLNRPPARSPPAADLVRPWTASQLLSKLRRRPPRPAHQTRALVRQKLSGDADIVTSQKCSLLCPLGQCRMLLPCRADSCQHVQCFDAKVYLDANEQKERWLCPVCDGPAGFERLSIDGFFVEVLQLTSGQCTEVELRPDGGWQPAASTENRPQQQQLCVQLDCSDSEDEDSQPPQPKRSRRQAMSEVSAEAARQAAPSAPTPPDSMAAVFTAADFTATDFTDVDVTDAESNATFFTAVGPTDAGPTDAGPTDAGPTASPAGQERCRRRARERVQRWMEISAAPQTSLHGQTTARRAGRRPPPPSPFWAGI